MKNILLMGAGKIGEMITEMLAGSGDYHVTVADISDASLAKMPKYDNVKTVNLNVTDQAALDAEMAGKFAVLSAAPYQITQYIAQSAVRNDVNYFDLTEDVACTRLVKDLAKDAKIAMIPQCGLAPGYISIVAYDMAKKFDKLQNIHMRVGALPMNPSNALKYNLTWSTDGLINEYCQPCEAVIGGKLTETPPLEELENFTLDGVDYEAFNTSGGLGTLCETLEGKVQNLNYRTARYPGHRDILKLLLHDLRLNERQDLLKDIFEYALPFSLQDVVLVYVTVSGDIDGRFVQDTYAHKVYNQKIGSKMWSAIQITTSAGICAMVDLLADGKLPAKGFVKQEDVNFDDFISNRFGKYYA